METMVFLHTASRPRIDRDRKKNKYNQQNIQKITKQNIINCTVDMVATKHRIASHGSEKKSFVASNAVPLRQQMFQCMVSESHLCDCFMWLSTAGIELLLQMPKFSSYVCVFLQGLQMHCSCNVNEDY